MYSTFSLSAWDNMLWNIIYFWVLFTVYLFAPIHFSSWAVSSVRGFVDSRNLGKFAKKPQCSYIKNRLTSHVVSRFLANFAIRHNMFFIIKTAHVFLRPGIIEIIFIFVIRRCVHYFQYPLSVIVWICFMFLGNRQWKLKASFWFD